MLINVGLKSNKRKAKNLGETLDHKSYINELDKKGIKDENLRSMK